jgi:hypothetical protein
VVPTAKHGFEQRRTGRGNAADSECGLERALGATLTLTLLGSARAMHVRRIDRASGQSEGRWRVEHGDRSAHPMEIADLVVTEAGCSRQCPVRTRGVPRPGIELHAHRPGRDRWHCRLSGAKSPRARARRHRGRKPLRVPRHFIDRRLEERRKHRRIDPRCDQVGTTGFRRARRKETERQERYHHSCPYEDRLPERKGPCHSLGFVERSSLHVRRKGMQPSRWDSGFSRTTSTLHVPRFICKSVVIFS